MHPIATATLLQGPQRQRVCVLRLVALQDDAAPEARAFVVNRSVIELHAADSAQAGTVRSSSESTLTPLPLTRADASAKATDFVRHRVAMGDVLQAHSGFDALADLLIESSMQGVSLVFPDPLFGTADSNAPTAALKPALADGDDAKDNANPPSASSHSTSPLSTAQRWHFPLPLEFVARRKPPPGEAAAVEALIAKLAPATWRQLPGAQQARLVWRLAERFDAGRSQHAAQQRLYQQVPLLVGLLESGDDLLDYCLAWALVRLNDPGATQALGALAQHGRTEATRALAQFGHLLLHVRHAGGHTSASSDAPDALNALNTLRGTRDLLLQRLGALASQQPQSAPPPPDRWPLPEPEARQADAHTLRDAHRLALIDPTVHAALCEALATLRLVPDVFPAARQIYKHAELAQDWTLLAALHARFERDHTAPTPDLNRSYYRNPRTGLLMADQGQYQHFQSVYRPGTRSYLRQRALRNVRRLVERGHSQAPQLAVALLLAMPATPADLLHANTRVYTQAHGWAAAAALLLGQLSEVQSQSHRTQLRHPLPHTTAAHNPENRLDGLPQMWDANPQATLALLRHSRNLLVQWVMARTLQDQPAWLAELPPSVVGELLASRFTHTAELGLTVAQAHLARLPAHQRLPWWLALARSTHPRAAQVLAQDMGAQLNTVATEPALVAALLLSPNASNRALGYAVTPEMVMAGNASTANTLNHVLAQLPTLDDAASWAADVAQGLQHWLRGAWAAHAPEVPAAALLALLSDPELPVLQVASQWVLLHPQALAQLPAATLQALLAAPDVVRQACGVRLLAGLPLGVLREQTELLFAYSQSPDAAMREAVRPAITRLAEGGDETRAACAQLAQRLHASLFRTQPADGVHADTLVLLQGPLRAVAPGQDADSVWRALQAQSTGAQQYGAWALSNLADSAYTLRQWATLGRHADVRVRERAIATVGAQLTPIHATTPEQADALLPLADSAFDNSQGYARQLFGEQLPDSALTPELLIRWVDHPQTWVRALGQQRLMRQMSAPEASLTLTRLAQHPSAQVQQFVTQWLLALPDEAPPERAARLRQLLPYFLTVLSQVHRGRVSKTRVQAFLRTQLAAPETAAVVAEVYARQVVGAGRLDQPQYMAGLRDIAARHPQLPLPFLQWQTPPSRTGRHAAPAHSTADRAAQPSA